MRTRYIPIFRRRREGKTDYASRKKIVLGKIPFVAPRISNKNISVQIIRPTIQGDRVLVSAHARELSKMGWKGSLKATPACYLVGLLAGLRAPKSEVTKAVLYLGIKPYVKNSRIAAMVKGLRDGGLNITADETTFPGDERISGVHISNWAEKILETKIRRPIFSKEFKKGFAPSQLQSHFSDIRNNLIKSIGGGSG